MSLIYRSQKDSILHSMPIVYHGALSLSSHSGVGTVKMLGGAICIGGAKHHPNGTAPGAEGRKV